jgi:hypothetical protein
MRREKCQIERSKIKWGVPDKIRERRRRNSGKGRGIHEL